MRYPKQTLRLPASYLVIAIAAALCCAPSALAATSNDTSQFTVTAGSLAFGTSPDVPNLPALTLNGMAQNLNGQMNNFSVSDATGAGAGWNVTVNGDNSALKSPVFKAYCPNATCGTDTGGPGYMNSGTPLAANSLSLNSTGAGFSPQNGTTGTPPAHQCNAGCFVDAAPGSPVKVVAAALSAGMGGYITTGYTGASLVLSAPSTVKAVQTNEYYRVDLLWTLASGP
jgi:hypothetical protein